MMPRSLFAALTIFLFFLSGFCNLVYEVVWARMFNLVFGVTVFAVSTVLAAFMLGMAAGGIIFGRMADKTKNNLVLFSFLHLGIFVSTICLLVAFPFSQSLYLGISNLWGPSFLLFRITIFCMSVGLMIVPTTLMGATFPVAVRMFAGRQNRRGSDIGTLYSVNTLGSVLGCIVTVFVLLGSLGMKETVIAAAGLDLAIALAAFAASRSSVAGSETA